MFVLLTLLCLLALSRSRTPVGRAVERWLIERPARWLEELNWRRAVALALAVAMLAALAGAVPLDVAFLGFGDLATMLDLVVLGALLSAGPRLARAARIVVAATASRAQAARQLIPSARAPRQARRVRRPRPARPEPDDGAPGWAVV